jgi:hypothetical protein
MPLKFCIIKANISNQRWQISMLAKNLNVMVWISFLGGWTGWKGIGSEKCAEQDGLTEDFSDYTFRYRQKHWL